LNKWYRKDTGFRRKRYKSHRYLYRENSV